jgi:uncharacterized membrane protein YfcA
MALALAFLVVALVYASVGQAGASGYIAVMGMAGFAPEAMKVTALTLNLVVAGLGTWQFWRAGLLSWGTAYPFAVLGVPFSLLGGTTHLPARAYYPVVGAILVLSCVQMLHAAWRRGRPGAAPEEVRPAPFVPALLTGALIGFVSGTTGTGGGVFLAPVILAMGWATVRGTAATTAVYNLMNSAAALLGAHATWGELPSLLPFWLAAVAVGGAIGALLGTRHLPETAMRAVLALLLVASGAKLLVP